MLKSLAVFAVVMALVCGAIGADAVKKTEKKIAQKTCPVLGGVINPKLFYEYKGQKIYVCCPGCIDVIKKDPEKYLEKVQEQQKEIADAKKIAQKTCPVMGGVINPKLFYEYKGQKIYICCPGCIEVIKKNPDKYLKKVQEEIAAADKKSSAN